MEIAIASLGLSNIRADLVWKAKWLKGGIASTRGERKGFFIDVWFALSVYLLGD